MGRHARCVRAMALLDSVKVTPAHDENDFKCGQRNNLDFITIFNEDGSVNDNGAPFNGMMRFDARIAVAEALKEKGLYVSEEVESSAPPPPPPPPIPRRVPALYLVGLCALVRRSFGRASDGGKRRRVRWCVDWIVR